LTSGFFVGPLCKPFDDYRPDDVSYIQVLYSNVFKELMVMLMGLRHSSWKLILSAAVLVVGFPVISQAQSPGDVIRIGTSAQWNQFESYWNQLINLSGAKTPSPDAGQDSSTSTQAATDPQALQQAQIRNLQISNLQLMPINQLSGSSQLKGSITNRNKKAVTVSSINFQIFGPDGQLAQTASAVPEPATIQPGATVTFQRQLLNLPARGRTVRLSNPAVSIQGGV
jgi:hypothetical protein